LPCGCYPAAAASETRRFATRQAGQQSLMKRSRRSHRVLAYGLIGAVIGGVAYTVMQIFISTKSLSIVHGLVLGVVAGFVIGILPAAEQDDAEKDRRMERARGGETGPADATLEGQESRDLASQRRRRGRRVRHDRTVS
jgi:F0F1-type ATP synthase assembly protein I